MAAHPAQSSPAWHAWEVPFLGIRTRFESNAPRVIALAQQALGSWTGVAPVPSDDGVEVVVRIVVEDRAGPMRHGRVALAYEVDGPRLTISGPGVHAAADADTRRAEATVSSSVVDDAEHFRYGLLESLALFPISYHDRQPVHAAAIVREDVVILLVGPAGVGKSTLTYAALRGGFRVFAEDIVFLQMRPAFRLWGLASRIHVSLDAAHRFPELASHKPTIVAAGEPKIVVSVEDRHRPRAPHAPTAIVCLLERPTGAEAALQPVDPATVRRHLAPTEPGFLLFADTIGPALDMLAAPGGWRLTLSSQPADAMPFLDQIVTAARAPRP